LTAASSTAQHSRRWPSSLPRAVVATARRRLAADAASPLSLPTADAAG
jgi:hypothetical protein